MRLPTIRILALAALSLGASTGLRFCQVYVGALVVPETVRVDEPFRVAFLGWGDLSSAPTKATEFGCVFQLPNGFSIRGVETHPVNPSTTGVTRDRPQVLGLFQVEPGHYLASFDGTPVPQQQGFNVTLDVVATAGTVGPQTIKVAIVEKIQTWSVADPIGVVDFAAVTSLPHARPFAVTAGELPFVRSGFGHRSSENIYSYRRMAVGDFDRDGRDDIAILDDSSTPPVLRTTLSRTTGPGPTVPSPGVNLSPLPQPRQWGQLLAVADFDDDGFADLATFESICYGDGSGGFTEQQRLTAELVCAGDFDGDGDTDLVFASTTSRLLIPYENRGNRLFWPLPLVSISGDIFELSCCDLTGDGRAEVALSAGDRSQAPAAWIEVLERDSAGTWRVTLRAPGAPQHESEVFVQDFTGDGVADLIFWDNGWVITSHDPAGGWSVQPVTNAPPGRLVRALDFDRDGAMDLVSTDPLAGYLTEYQLYRGLGGGAFARVPDVHFAQFAGGDLGPVGDFDGDTFPDLADTSATVWLNRMTGTAPFGAGCTGAGLRPALAARGAAVRGNATFGLEASGMPAGAGCIAWVGLDRQQSNGLRLPFELAGFGAPGCAILVDPYLPKFLVADASGLAFMPVPIPAHAPLHGLAIAGQAMVFVGGANPLGVLTTPGLVFKID